MEKIIFTFASLLIITSLLAQSPDKMSYQAVIRNSNHVLVSNSQIGMEINIRQGSPTGTIVYSETQTPYTNVNGLVSIEIGGNTEFHAIDWAEGPYFLETKTASEPPLTSYNIFGTSQLLSVPYALHAHKADAANESDPVFANSQASKINSSDISNLNNLSGINTGDQDLNGLATTSSLTTGLATKVDKESGKALSSNDYTTEEKTKLAGIADGAEVNIQADWKAMNGAAQILNKPANIDEDKTDDVTLTGDQTITGNKSFSGTTTVATPVNASDAVTKAYVDALLERIEALEESALLHYGFTDDRDGQHYNVLKIGNQLWMAENLKYLPQVTGSATGSVSSPYYYVYDYNGTVVADAKATTNYDVYGVLYNWPAAMNGAASSTSNPSGVQGVCPTGWHLPSTAEFSELTDYLGGMEGNGGKLKETGTGHWFGPNEGATNETGFTALPGGRRGSNGLFSYRGSFCYWWSATFSNTDRSYYHHLSYDNDDFYRNLQTLESGFSVRCIKD
ncbi:MAG TPA: FISUMP domain-containing protein [Saprospiraceae bacterium]|nr:FISUMP domain-containing protein [Saprospiraceae bacterium]